MTPPDVSAVVLAHREGALAGRTLRSMADAVAMAEAAGLSVELLAVLDTPDPPTRRQFADAALPLRLLTCELRDQGAARNLAAAAATGRWIAFLDGDDLWSDNWLIAAHAAARTAPERAIIHPEFNWLFGGRNDLVVKPGDDDSGFDPHFLRTANYWDAMAFLPRDLALELPFAARDLAAGWALEDWDFNCRALLAGAAHRVAPGTIHFKRRRAGSQHMQAAGAAALPPRSALMDYAWAAAHRCPNAGPATPPPAGSAEGN